MSYSVLIIRQILLTSFGEKDCAGVWKGAVMAAKSRLEIFETALVTLKERLVDLAKFLASPQSSRDDISRWVTQITATQQAIEAIQKAIGDENSAKQ